MRELLIAALLMSAGAAVFPTVTATHNEGNDCQPEQAETAAEFPPEDPEIYVQVRDISDKAVWIYQETNGAEGLQTGGHFGEGPVTGNEDVDQTTSTVADEIPTGYNDPPKQAPCDHGADTLVL